MGHEDGWPNIHTTKERNKRMEKNINYTLVGAFVILLFACIVLSIIWLSAGLSIKQYTTYQVYMKESVSGLSLDSSVEYNGVNVGSVSNIALNQKNPQLVELLLKIKEGTPITEGTQAVLNVKGLTGIAFIALQDKGNDTRPLPILPGQSYPVIGTAPSFLLRLDTAINKLNDSLFQLSHSVESLLDKDNLRAIKQLLSNMNQISQTLNTQTLPNTNQAIIHLNMMTQQFSTLSTEIKNNPSILIRGKTESSLGPGEK